MSQLLKSGKRKHSARGPAKPNLAPRLPNPPPGSAAFERRLKFNPRVIEIRRYRRLKMCPTTVAPFIPPNPYSNEIQP